MIKNKLSIISTYSIGHFYIDFISAFILSLIIFQNKPSIISIASIILIYNIIAFGAQPFFGFLVDQHHEGKLSVITGLLISTAGVLFFSKPLISAILLGIGNAMYHVGGGAIILNLEPTRATYPGIYVAPGAIGLFIGGLLGYMQIKPEIFIPIGIIITTTLILSIKKISLPKIPKFKENKSNIIGIILLLLLISVCMRALIGYSLNLEWKSIIMLGSVLVLAISSGKFVGGFLADKWGFMKTGMISLIIAAPLLTFFQTTPIIVFIGAFCFNLVMPITLTALAQAMPNYKGFVFGLTTLSLIIGYILFLILKNYILIGQMFTIIIILINIGSLYVGLKKYEEIKI